MATPIRNQATLNFNSGDTAKVISSNVAEVSLQGPLEVNKHALESGYQINDILTYTVIIKNTSNATLTNLTITDDLGAYKLADGVTTVYPLTYVGPTNEYVNNAFVRAITPDDTDPALVYTIASLAGDAVLELQYKVKTNEYAPAVVGTSQIKNTVTITGVTPAVTSSYTIPVASYADVAIEKTMSPNPVINGSPITYTFKIENYGTIDATLVKLNDTFTPAPTLTSAAVDGETKTADKYKYTPGTGVFLYPTDAEGSTETFTIPKATFTPDITSGKISVVPGSKTVVITGTL